MCEKKIIVSDARGQQRAVRCGKCDECRQAAADARASLIRCHSPKQTTCYFITLTYENRCVPYITRESWQPGTHYVLRDCHLSHSGILNYGRYVIGDFSSLAAVADVDFEKLPKLVVDFKNGKPIYDKDKVGVYWPSDNKRFIKRLRQILKRKYSYEGHFSYFLAPEYGESSCRPHLHFLLWLDSSFPQNALVTCISKAWPFSDIQHFQKSNEEGKRPVEIAKAPASYLASYVNNSSVVPQFLRNNFKVRCSHSLDFGNDKSDFELRKVLQAFEKGLFEYTSVYLDRNGKVVSVNLPYPQRVISKLFPKLPGFGRLDYTTIYNVISNPRKYIAIDERACKINLFGPTKPNSKSFVLPLVYKDKFGGYVFYQHNAFNGLKNKIFNAFNRWRQLKSTSSFDPDIEEYIKEYINFWTRHDLHFYRKYYDELGYDGIYQFDNLFLLPQIPSDLQQDIPFIELHPDENPYDQVRNFQLRTKFRKNIKKRKLQFT